ncbi:hypothetical protein SBDP1_220044 [Syntrophobacter sp. SbD1]|nr:hypothetical protein SBDP1_220044 [Syntrophobacter sp. SbD1]
MFESGQAGTSARVQGGYYGFADEQVMPALCLNGLDHERGLGSGVFLTIDGKLR